MKRSQSAACIDLTGEDWNPPPQRRRTVASLKPDKELDDLLLAQALQASLTDPDVEVIEPEQRAGPSFTPAADLEDEDSEELAVLGTTGQVQTKLVTRNVLANSWCDISCGMVAHNELHLTHCSSGIETFLIPDQTAECTLSSRVRRVRQMLHTVIRYRWQPSFGSSTFSGKHQLHAYRCRVCHMPKHKHIMSAVCCSVSASCAMGQQVNASIGGKVSFALVSAGHGHAPAQPLEKATWTPLRI